MRKELGAPALALAAALMLSGCSKGGADEEIKLPIYGAEEVAYEIAEARYMDLSDSSTVAAVIGYPYSVYLSYPAEALVTRFDISNNMEVKKDQVLAELDSSALDYEINNQQTILNSAYANSLSGGIAAQLQYKIESSRMEMLLAEKESYTIRAPFDGVITSINHVTEGDTAEKGALCCSVSEADKVTVYVEGSDAANFRFGQKVQVKIDGDMYDAVTVEAPDTAPDTASGANRAVFKLGEGVFDEIERKNPLAITAGWATIYVTEERKNVLAVPDAAIKTRGTQAYVMLVDGEERYKLNVTTGKQLGGYTEIINGISEGDVVMAQGSGVFAAAEDSASDGNDG